MMPIDPVVEVPIADAPVDVPPDPPQPPPAPTVSALLATSRRAHLQYHQSLPRMAAVNGSAGPQLQQGDADAALSALKAAAAARAQAELIDPTHNDRAWIEDAQTTPHQETLVFYLQQLAK